MSLARKLAYNTLIQIVSRILALLVSVVTVILLTRYLGTSGYGNYVTILAYLGVFAVLADFGLNYLVAREIPKEKISAQKLVGNIMGLRFMLTLGALILASLIVLVMPYSDLVKKGVWVAIFSIFFLLMIQPMMGILQVHLQMDKFSVAEVLGRGLTLFLTFFFIKFNLGFIAILLAYVLGNFLIFILNYLWANRYIKISLQFDFSLWKKLFHESLPLGIMVIAGTMYLNASVLILSLFKGSEDVGIYGVASRIMEIMLAFPALFMGIILPIYAANLKQKTKLKEIFQKAFDFLAIWAVPTVLLGIFLAPQIVNIIGGPGFEASAKPLIILFSILVFSFLSSAGLFLMIALGRQNQLAWVNILAVVVVIILGLFLIPAFSYIGAAFATIAGHILIAGFSFYLVYRAIRFLPSIKILLKVILVGIILALILLIQIRFLPGLAINQFIHLSFLMKILEILIVGLMSSFLYLVILISVKIISKKFIEELLFSRK